MQVNCRITIILLLMTLYCGIQNAFVNTFSSFRSTQYKDICTGTIEMQQRAHIFKINCCLKVYKVHIHVTSLSQFRDYGNGIIWLKYPYFFCR